jgi:hypothetical protein
MEKGLAEVIKKSDERAAAFGKDRINFLFLGDREIAELRFITDAEGLIKAKIHTLEEMSPKGKKFRKKYCTMDDIGTCVNCSAGAPLKSFIYLWAYILNIYHTTQNPKAAEADSVKWTPIKLKDGKTYYVEAVNGPLVFRISMGHKGAYQNMIVGFARDYGTLCDRNYRISRTGKELDTVYQLTPLKESPAPEAIKELKLPDLGDVITGKVKSFNQEDAPAEELPISDPFAEGAEEKQDAQDAADIF